MNLVSESNAITDVSANTVRNMTTTALFMS